VAGAALVAVLVACAIGTSRVLDVTGFYPLVTHPSAWRWADGNFVDEGRGLRVLADGALEGIDAVRRVTEASPVPRHGRAAAALAMACAGLALPMMVSQTLLGGEGPRRGFRAPPRAWIAAGCAAAVVGSVLLFQAAAARRVPAVTGALPPLVLLVFAARRYRAEGT
jgi:hypothetical protein